MENNDESMVIKQFGEITETEDGTLRFSDFHCVGDGYKSPAETILVLCIERLKKELDEVRYREAGLVNSTSHLEAAPQPDTEQVIQDAMLHGVGVSRNGKRIAPENYRAQPDTVEPVAWALYRGERLSKPQVFFSHDEALDNVDDCTTSVEPLIHPPAQPDTTSCPRCYGPCIPESCNKPDTVAVDERILTHLQEADDKLFAAVQKAFPQDARDSLVHEARRDLRQARALLDQEK